MDDPHRMRELACWYREFAERSGNPTIWDARLRTAEDLEAEAARLEEIVTYVPQGGGGAAQAG